jgi:peptidoglycan/LPS O-acetylase OafA/YrhL
VLSQVVALRRPSRGDARCRQREGEIVRSKNTGYIDRLDHLRAFAAIIVLLFHVKLSLATWKTSTDYFPIPIIDQGHVGVFFFMVITGFIFAHIVGDNEIDVKRFYLNRILRIYPLYVFLVLLSYYTASPEDRGTLRLLLTLLPTGDGQPAGTYALTMWSLAVEMQFYLLFPFVYPELRKRGWYGYCVLLMALIGLRWFCWRHDGNIHSLTFGTLFGGADCFVIGMMASKIHRRMGKTVIPSWMPLVVFVALNLVLLALFSEPLFWHVHWGNARLHEWSPSSLWIIWPTIAGGMFAALMLSYLRAGFTIARPLNATLDWLGTISYSIYGWHVAVISVCFGWPLIVPGQWVSPYLYGPIVLLAAIPVAAVSYYVIERPFLSMRVRYLKHDEQKSARQESHTLTDESILDGGKKLPRALWASYHVSRREKRCVAVVAILGAALLGVAVFAGPLGLGLTEQFVLYKWIGLARRETMLLGVAIAVVALAWPPVVSRARGGEPSKPDLGRGYNLSVVECGEGRELSDHIPTMEPRLRSLRYRDAE